MALLLAIVLLQLISKTEGQCSSNIADNIRLTGSNVRSEGRVEVCVDGGWGTVCRHHFGQVEISVVCRQLGYSTIGGELLDYSGNEWLDRSIPIVMDDVECSGNEVQLIDCDSDEDDDCFRWEAVAVRCIPCVEGDLRLQDGLSVYEGRLEVCHSDSWGTVCDDPWTQQASIVACRQLGFNMTDYARILRSNLFSVTSPGTPVILDGVECTGNESALVDCQHRQIGSSNCNHTRDVNLRCGQCSEYDVRLVDGAIENEGRVEVCVSGRWGTVCDNGWDALDATVVCRQLRLPSTASQAGEFPANPSLPIAMDSVRCNGEETSLGDCEYRGSNNLRSCSGAGVRCFHEPSSSPIASSLPETSTSNPESSTASPESSTSGPESSTSLLLYALIALVVVLVVLCITMMVICIMGICIYKKKTHSKIMRLAQTNPLEMQKSKLPDDIMIYDDATGDRIYETIPDTIPPPPPLPPPHPFEKYIVQPPVLPSSSYQHLVMPLNPDNAYAVLEDAGDVVEEDEKKNDGSQCQNQLATNPEGGEKNGNDYQELLLAMKNPEEVYTKCNTQP